MLSICFEACEELVAAAHFRQTGAKADLDVDDFEAGFSRGGKDCGAALQELIGGLNVDRDNAGLAVHGEEGGVFGVDGEVCVHGYWSTWCLKRREVQPQILRLPSPNSRNVRGPLHGG